MVFLHLASLVKGLQEPKDERKCRDYGTAATKANVGVHICRKCILYTRSYFAVSDHCRSVFFVRWSLVRHNTVNGTAPALLLTLM